MDKPALHAELPLGGFIKSFGATNVAEIQGIAIHSIGLPIDAANALSSIQSTLGAQWPTTGESTVSSDNNIRLLGLQADQIFAVENLSSANTADAKAIALESSAYITDQSDSWAGLEIKGPMARHALERICPIDLHPSVFSFNSVARTSMEHLATIIVCIDTDHYHLFSPASSARSFLHAVETSFHNVSESTAT